MAKTARLLRDQRVRLDDGSDLWLPAGTARGEPHTDRVPNPKCWDDYVDPAADRIPETVINTIHESIDPEDRPRLLEGNIADVVDRVMRSADPKEMAAQVLEANAMAGAAGRKGITEAMQNIVDGVAV